MKIIPLTQGKSAMVDDEDYKFLLQFKWCVNRERVNWYALTVINGSPIKMHWLLLPLQKPLVTDHIDGNGLNNQRLNLRRVTQRENCRNRKKPVNCSSLYKGVHWCKTKKTWVAQIQIDLNRSKRKFLGYFNSEISAARIYDEAAKQHFGECARINFPGGVP